MSKKMKMIPSIFKTTNQIQQPWQWPSSCKHPKTLSFRASNNDEVFKTVNSVFLDTCTPETPESWFTNSSDCASTFSDDRSEEPSRAAADDNSVEMIIRGVRSSERLFFEPGGETSSILKEEYLAAAAEEEEEEGKAPFEAESVALAMESDDPYTDFKKSMMEMVESHGLKDWDCLEELLGWYLRMNGKVNHGFILAAFVDLLVGLGGAANCNNNNDDCNSSVSSTAAVCSLEDSTTTTSYSSAPSCFSSPVTSENGAVVVEDDEERDIVVQS